MRNASAALDALRIVTAAGVLLSASVHQVLYAQGYSDISVIGPLFLVNAVSGLVLGLSMLIWRHWLPAFLSAAFGAVTAAAYWVSVVYGLFGVKEVTGGWAVILAESGEYVAVVGGLVVAGMLLRRRPARKTPRPEQVRVAR